MCKLWQTKMSNRLLVWLHYAETFGYMSPGWTDSWTGELLSMPIWVSSGVFFFLTDRVNTTCSDIHYYSWVSSYSRPKHWFSVDLEGCANKPMSLRLKSLGSRSLSAGRTPTEEGNRCEREAWICCKTSGFHSQNILLVIFLFLYRFYLQSIFYIYIYVKKKRKEKRKTLKICDLIELRAHKSLVLSSMLHYRLEKHMILSL